MDGLGNRFRVFCQTTSCHGCPQIGNSTSLAAKIFWSLLVACLSFILIYNTISTVSDFFDEDVRWSTEISENIERALEHPSLLFCNYNRFKKSEVQKLKIPTNVVEHLLGSNAATHSLYKRKSLTAAQAWIRWGVDRNLTAIELLRTCSHKCKGMVKMLLMTVSGKVQREVPDPCEATITNHSLTMENVVPFDLSTQCNRLLVDPTEHKYRMSTMGQGKGTTVLLDTEPQEYLDSAINNAPDFGIAFQLTYGKRVEFGNWINLAPGYHIWVGMKLTKHVAGQAFQSHFRAPCSKEPKMRHLPDIYYSKEPCYYDCDMIPFVSICNCHYIETEKYPVCKTEQMIKCYTILSGNSSRDYSEQITACKESCRDPCESQSIAATATYTGFPVAQQLNSLKNNMPKLFGNMSIAEIQRRYILLDVYYSSGSVTLVKWRLRNSMSLLFSNLGGQMGLFLGISIITIVHGLAHFCVGPARNLVAEKFLNDKPDGKSRANSVRNRRVSVVSKQGAKQ